MAKIDLKSAHRYVVLSPSKYKMTGLKHKFSGDSDYTYMFDSRLPFGASESVECFHRISRGIVRVARRRAKRWNCHIIGYLDNFLVIGASRRNCQAVVDILLQLLSELGFTVNWPKFCPPSQSVIVLGIKINSVTGTIRIPEAKMAVLTDCLDQFCLKKKATKRELQVLLGKLALGAKCAKALRPTFQSLIKLQSCLQKTSHRGRISRDIQQDLHYFRAWCYSMA